MPRRSGEPPAVREDEFSIEIDMTRGKWPFLKAMWGQDKKGRTRLIFVSDSNEGGQVINQGEGVSIIALSKKKAQRLADFINKTIDKVPD